MAKKGVKGKKSFWSNLLDRLDKKVEAKAKSKKCGCNCSKECSE